MAAEMDSGMPLYAGLGVQLPHGGGVVEPEALDLVPRSNLPELRK